MTDRPSGGKRPGSRTTGANTLITAASLALTLSGWAVLTDNEANTVMPAEVSLSAPTLVLSELPPVPTLVPEPDWAARVAEAPAVPLRRVVPPTRTAVPQAVPASQPQPVTVTRSSQ